MNISARALYHYQIPLDRQLPVGMQRIDCRSGLVIELEAIDAMGHVTTAQVEIAPLSGLDIVQQPLLGFSQESLPQVQQELGHILASLTGQPIACLLALASQTQLPSIAFGLSLLHAKLCGQLDGHNLKLNELKTIPLIYRVRDEPLSALHERVRALPAGTYAVKIKVAQAAIEVEIELIHQVLAIRPGLKLRLDANRGFTLEQAIEFAACMPQGAIEYIEEPCINPADNPIFYQAIGMPWALDETLYQRDYQFSMQAGLTALIVKPMLIGSLEKLQRLQNEAMLDGVRVILSSALEASLGIEALARLSRALTPLEIPGLDTLDAFSVDLLIGSGKDHCLSLDELALIKRWD